MKKALLTLSLIIISFTTTFACRCTGYNSIKSAYKEKYKACDFVISATVQYVKDSVANGNFLFLKSDPAYWRHGGYHAVFKVNKIYKGDIKTDTIEITPNWSNCSQYFSTNSTYIIFGYKDSQGLFTTSICSPNFLKNDRLKWKTFRRIRKRS